MIPAKQRSSALAWYHQMKEGHRERERRDRYNAKRRKGPARGNYGPRLEMAPAIACEQRPLIRISHQAPVYGEPIFSDFRGSFQ